MSIGGSGAALNVTCGLAIINTNYPNEREKNLGFFEGGTGLGLLLGPLLGSLLYTIGGYCLPFLTFGIISLLLFPEIQRNLRELKKIARPRKPSDTNFQQVDESSELSIFSTMGSQQ